MLTSTKITSERLEYMTTQLLNLTGLTCDDCARHVETALNSLSDVTAYVTYEPALATVRHNGDISADALLRAVEDAGYGA